MLLYRLLISILAVIELAKLAVRCDGLAIRARLGLIKPEPSSARSARVWLHAASNGELTSVKPLIEAMIQDGRHILITTNTQSAVDMAKRWALAQTDVILAPLDLQCATRRVLRNWTVTSHITLESDLWPHRILMCPGPVLVLGARLTERSAKGWQRFASLARTVLQKVSYLSAQDPASRDRFQNLGLPAAAIGPVFDLKALYTRPVEAPDKDLIRSFNRDRTWLAASTHDGEDAIILDAHKIAQAQIPELRLILAPRHPKRANDIVELAKARQLTLARRSTGDAPENAEVYLVDTLGEMHLWYTLAGITFVAGSLTNRGGHTPYEPAAFGSAILHGPDTANFRAAYTRLNNANASQCVTTAQTLASALIGLSAPQTQHRLGAAAQKALQQDTDLNALLRDINAVLDA